jgi:hypothetical protein
MRKALATLGVAAVCVEGCASLLGYDDLSARSDEQDAATFDTAADTSADAVSPAAHPPDRPPGARSASGKGKTLWLMMKRVYLGSKSHLGVDSTTAWREWGFDLDGRCTGLEESRTGVDTCTRATGSDQDVLVDGDLCRDNQFGGRLVPLIKVSSANFEDDSNKSLAKGTNTWLIRIDDLDDGADDAYAPGRIYSSGVLEKTDPPLKLDGTDVRTVQSDSIEGGDLEKAKVNLLGGYLRGNVWVSGDGDDFAIPIPMGGSAAVGMPLVKARMTIQLAVDHLSTADCLIGGALPVASIDTVIKPIASTLGFCPGTPLYESMRATLLKFPDVVVGSPTLNDPSKPCDGLSLGIGFETVRMVAPTTIVPPVALPPGKCGDAGI